MAEEEVSDDWEGDRGGEEWDSGMAPGCGNVASSFSMALLDRSLFMVVSSAFLVLSRTISCMISSRDVVRCFVWDFRTSRSCVSDLICDLSDFW